LASQTLTEEENISSLLRALLPGRRCESNEMVPKFGFGHTRGSALQISANHVFKKKNSKKNSNKKFKKKFKKKFQKISKKKIHFFLEIKKTGSPKLLRMS
jgi:hypothetical protein